MAGMEPAKRIRSLPVASLLAMWMAAAGGSPAHAGTIHVYRGQSIQAAIAVASNGDKILVHPGTFKEAVNLLGKAIDSFLEGAWMHEDLVPVR